MVLKTIRDLEKGLGLPKLSQAAEILKNLPDEKTLRLIKGIINDMGKVKGSTDELMLAVALVKFIVEADMEHLNAVKNITGNLVKFSRLFPKDVLSKLPVDVIIEEIKKSLGED